MEQVGTQVKLPFRRAFQIAVQGIRIRFGRSLVTLAGVVLGIAFLMSNLTAQAIKKSLVHERELRATVTLMLTLVKSEVGTVTGKRIAIAAFGNLSAAERLLISQIIAATPAEVRAFGFTGQGVSQTELAHLGEGAALMLVVGEVQQCPVSPSELTAGMMQKVVLDSLEGRRYPGNPNPAVRRELFFGKQTDEQLAKLQEDAQKETFRMLWIVAISLLVTVIGVANALLMSVTERFREIGTLKCLGALSSFIRMLFLIESSVIGLAGSIIGVVAGVLLPSVVYGVVYRFGLVFGSLPYGWLSLAALGAVAVGSVLAMIAALYPARIASRMVPAAALRSTV